MIIFECNQNYIYMGYRTGISYISKAQYKWIYDLTIDEFIEEFNVECVGDFDISDLCTRLHEFGKYTEFDPPKKSIKPFFKNKDMQKAYVGDDIELYVVTKDFLLYIIDHYTQKVKKYYNTIFQPFIKDVDSEFVKSKTISYTDYNSDFDRMYSFDFSKITRNESNALGCMINHFHEMINEWNYKPYDLDETNPEITMSWKYEYAIFELVRIYKAFNWKKNQMIYYGG